MICTAFQDSHVIARGPLSDVALAVKAATASAPQARFLTFDDATGKVVDLDLRGSETEIRERLAPRPARGRPKLGVVAREVTLLPRQWEWLAAQPGGASQVLRRLIEDARRADGGRSQARAAAYAFMSAMAGDLPGFEEASRALFAGDRAGLSRHSQDWPADIRDHVGRLLEGVSP